MTDKPIKYIDGRELMERWGMGSTALIQYCDGYIQAYHKERVGPPSSWQKKTHIEGSVKINADVILVPVALPHELSITGCLFLIDEINQFEKDHPEIINQPLSKLDAQELGRLRREMSIVPSTMEAIGAVVLWQMSQEYKLTQPGLKKFMQTNFPKIEGKTMNKRIWVALPKGIKNSGTGNHQEPMS